MLRLAKMSLLLALAWTALDSSEAAAQPERDHRTFAPAPPPPPPSQRRYRRRPGPRLMAPLRVDLGFTEANTSSGVLPGFELRAGIHWASLSPQPTNTDVGVGLFGAVLPGPDRGVIGDSTDDDVVYGGAYLEVGQTLSHGDWWRTWGTVRGEYLGASTFGEDRTGFGIAGRVSAEVYASGVGIEPRGLFLGTYAVGVYAEASARQLGPDVNALQISAGLTFRTPLVFAP